MSQSDYIKYKKSSVELNDLKGYPSILDTSDYIEFKQFAVENTVVNTSITYNKMKPTIYNVTSTALSTINAQTVFNMERIYPSTCSDTTLFPLCRNTQTRVNRTSPWWKDVANNTNIATIIPIIPRVYVKNPKTQSTKCLRCFSNNNGYPYTNAQTPYSNINPKYKKYKNGLVENSTFNTNLTDYSNRRLNQIMCNVCSKTCNSVTV